MANEKIKEHTPVWPQMPYHPYGILISAGPRSGRKYIKSPTKY